MEVDPYVYGPEVEGPPYATLSYDMTLNDLKGGKATLKVMADTGSGWFEVPEQEYYQYPVYDPEAEQGEVWSDSVYVVLDPPTEDGGIAGRAKLVFEIEYPDGTTETVETESRPFHKGSFARINTDYGNGGYRYDYEYDPETESSKHIFSFDVIIDPTLVDPSRVSAEYNDLWLEEPWSNFNTADIRLSAGDDGFSHMFFYYTSNEKWPSGEYWFSPEVLYVEDEYNAWEPFNLYLYYVFVAPD